MADKYISAGQAYFAIRHALYETAFLNIGVNVEDFASACQKIADNHLKIWLKNVPAADVKEVQRGEWKPYMFANGTQGWEEEAGRLWKCSVCGCSYIGTHNYCPNCGAKMEGNETDDETH